ncbi:MAG: DNA repair protein RecO [Defluviitaleaceae bacterium]|nr:DNA repair protein RecO [Defluviitaleaceae bacterium]
MKTFKARGIVLRETSVGECDKMVTLLLKGTGKLGVYAKGARRSGSKFLAATQLFTYSDFVLTQGNNFFALAQADVIETFFGLGGSYELLVAASRAARLCDRVVLEQEPCDDILRLLIYTQDALCKGKPPELTEAAFAIKFLAHSGLAPMFSACSVCGKPLESTDAGKQGLFPADQHGVICSGCYIAGQINLRIIGWLAESTRQAAAYVVDKEARRLFSFQAAPQVLEQLATYADTLLRIHFNIGIRD